MIILVQMAQQSPRLSFGPFTLDMHQRMLLCGGAAAPLNLRSIVLVRALVEAAGEVVSKQRLLELAWPELAVEESNLTVQMAKLRKCLGLLAADGRDWIITVPRIGYRLSVPFHVSDASGIAGPALDPRPLLAVLPFANLSGDPEQAYLADGIAEELVTALSRFRTFAVVARSSTFAYRDRKTDVRQIARDLGVGYLLDGSVRRSGKNLRVATHLIDATTGIELWADRFDGHLSRIFDVEDRITEAVIGVVEPQIRKSEIERSRRRRPGSLSAYDLYLQALPNIYASAPHRWNEALGLLLRAIELDPGFAPALAAAAWTFEKRIRGVLPDIGPDDIGYALDLAQRALAADGEDATVMAIAGWVPIAINAEFDTGLALVRRALHTNPNNLVVLNLAGSANVFAGDLDEARASYHRAFQLSPRAPDAFLSLTGIGHVHLVSGEFKEAIHWCQQSLRVNGAFPMTIGIMACAYALAGQLEQARECIGRLLTIYPNLTVAIMAARHLRDRSRWDTTINGLRLAGLPEG